MNFSFEMEEAIVKKEATLKKRNVDDMLEVDPGILQRLKETLPKCPYFDINCSNFEPFKWDYAVVLLTSIEELKQILRDHPDHPLMAYVKYKTLHEEFYQPMCFTGQFTHVYELVPENVDPSFKVTKEFLDSMSQALAKDVASFRGEAPAHLFGSLEDWKQHECNRMMKEMKMPPADTYEMVFSFHKKYKACKQTGRQHQSAMEHFKCDGSYNTLVNYMTLLKRIQVLENQVQEHAQVLEKCVALLEK